jgi:hypothetical protein
MPLKHRCNQCNDPIVGKEKYKGETAKRRQLCPNCDELYRFLRHMHDQADNWFVQFVYAMEALFPDRSEPTHRPIRQEDLDSPLQFRSLVDYDPSYLTTTFMDSAAALSYGLSALDRS